MTNPFAAYSVTYMVVMFVYFLPWSTMYPMLSLDMLMFFFLTCAVSGFFAYTIKIKKPGIYRERSNYKKYMKILLLLYFCYCLDFLYMNSIPLLSPDPEGGFRAFKGIPTLHVLFVSFNGFYTSAVFEKYLQTKENRYLYLWFFSFSPHVLLFTRGTIIVSLIVSFLIFCFYRTIKLKTYIVGIAICIFLFYIFGIAGNIRISQEIDSEVVNNSEQILSIGEATKEFRESWIPKEFFWSYLYISSPMANLQNIINISSNNGDEKWMKFVTGEFIPDFINKRITNNGNDEHIPLLTPALNVSTSYAGPYLRAGWLGMFIMYLYYFILTLLYCIVLMRKNKYQYIGIATFSMLVYLSIFSNVFVFSGWSFQLVYPLVFGFKYKI